MNRRPNPVSGRPDERGGFGDRERELVADREGSCVPAVVLISLYIGPRFIMTPIEFQFGGSAMGTDGVRLFDKAMADRILALDGD